MPSDLGSWVAYASLTRDWGSLQSTETPLSFTLYRSIYRRTDRPHGKPYQTRESRGALLAASPLCRLATRARPSTVARASSLSPVRLPPRRLGASRISRASATSRRRLRARCRCTAAHCYKQARAPSSGSPPHTLASPTTSHPCPQVPLAALHWRSAWAVAPPLGGCTLRLRPPAPLAPPCRTDPRPWAPIRSTVGGVTPRPTPYPSRLATPPPRHPARLLVLRPSRLAARAVRAAGSRPARADPPGADPPGADPTAI